MLVFSLVHAEGEAKASQEFCFHTLDVSLVSTIGTTYIKLLQVDTGQFGPSRVGICVAHRQPCSIHHVVTYSSRYLLPSIRLTTNGRVSLPETPEIALRIFRR